MKIELFHRFSNKLNAEKSALLKMFSSPKHNWLKATKTSIIIDLEETPRHAIWVAAQDSAFAAPMDYILRMFVWNSSVSLDMYNTEVVLDHEDIERLKKVSATTTDPDQWHQLGLRWWQDPKDGFGLVKNPAKSIAYINLKDKLAIAGMWMIDLSSPLYPYAVNADRPDNWVSANYNADERKLFMAVRSAMKKNHIAIRNN